MNHGQKDNNLDQGVIDSFGREWSVFDYTEESVSSALDAEFKAYCAAVNLEDFDPSNSVAADFGAGSGRWTSRLLKHFSLVYALEPSDLAVQVLKRKFDEEDKVVILNETVGSNSIPNNSLDFAMCLGVLHHIPNTALAIRDISQKIKSGGTFHCYLYYKLDEKPLPYRGLFLLTTPIRWLVSRLPYLLRRLIAQAIAIVVYLPLARIARFFDLKGKDVSNFPLHHYAHMPLVMLQNDALDRFGTRLEQRFSKAEIIEMLAGANFNESTLKFSQEEPFWTFSAKKN